MQWAESMLLQLVQKESFSGGNDTKLTTLYVYKDEQGLLRIKSLISNRQDTLDFRHPIVLDPSHSIVTKLIEHTHRRLKYA